MSMDLMVKALKTKVGNPLRKLVLVKLADNASDLGECWPSYQHIADQCEIAKSSVRKHIKALEEQGLLSIEHREGPKGNSSNMYRLSLHPVVTDGTPMLFGTTPPVVTDGTRTNHSFEPVKETHIDELFEMAWSAYPKRDGSNPKAAAQKCWNARLKEGVTVVEMVNGINRYRAYCAGKETIGTAFVMQASRFLGTNREYEAAWSAPAGLSSAPAGKGKRPRPANLPDHKFPHPEWDNGVYEICTVGRHNPETGYLLPGQY